MVIDVKSFSSNELIVDVTQTEYVDGERIFSAAHSARWERVTRDYETAILGTWEGHVTTGSSVFDDREVHRWEYRADGTYIYYIQDGDRLVPSDDACNDYFVAGNLLCTRWGKEGPEHCEWWEITSIENNAMTWTALRRDDQGQPYEAGFSMTRVR